MKGRYTSVPRGYISIYWKYSFFEMEFLVIVTHTDTINWNKLGEIYMLPLSCSKKDFIHKWLFDWAIAPDPALAVACIWKRDSVDGALSTSSIKLKIKRRNSFKGLMLRKWMTGLYIVSFCSFLSSSVFSLADNHYHGYILILTSLERKKKVKGRHRRHKANIKVSIKENKK